MVLLCFESVLESVMGSHRCAAIANILTHDHFLQWSPCNWLKVIYFNQVIGSYYSIKSNHRLKMFIGCISVLFIFNSNKAGYVFCIVLLVSFIVPLVLIQWLEGTFWRTGSVYGTFWSKNIKSSHAKTIVSILI